MKSLNKMPEVLIEETCKTFADKLWEIALNEGNNCRFLASGIESFEESLKNSIINELYVSSIVDEENITEGGEFA